MDSSLNRSTRGRGGLRLAKDLNRPAKDPNQLKGLARLRSKERRESKVSNGSSLLIDGGDVSDLMFKDFY